MKNYDKIKPKGLSVELYKVDDDSAGSSAIMMKGAIVAAALGLVAYM